jgi:hypothetical protein
MTVQRTDQVVLLDGVCPVEDAELLLIELQSGPQVIDWSRCTHLHTAVLQVILAAGVPMRGTPAHPELARWIGPLLHQESTSHVHMDA